MLRNYDRIKDHDDDDDDDDDGDDEEDDDEDETQLPVYSVLTFRWLRFR